MQQNTSHESEAEAQPRSSPDCDIQVRLEGGNNHLETEDKGSKEIAGKTIQFQVLHRFTNNLTVDVDESNLDHHHDVLTTMSPNSVSGNPNNNNNNNDFVVGSNNTLIDSATNSSVMDTNANTAYTNTDTLSSTNRGSDESTVTSSSSGNTNHASGYQIEPDGTLKPYIDLQEFGRIIDNHPDLKQELAKIIG